MQTNGALSLPTSELIDVQQQGCTDNTHNSCVSNAVTTAIDGRNAGCTHHSPYFMLSGDAQLQPLATRMYTHAQAAFIPCTQHRITVRLWTRSMYTATSEDVAVTRVH